jgi:hypothetical protein
MTPRSRDMNLSELFNLFDPLEDRGRREDRVSTDTRGPRAAKSTRQNRRLSQIRPSLHNGLNGCFVLSPGIGFLAPGRDNALRTLRGTPAPRRQDHTT